MKKTKLVSLSLTKSASLILALTLVLFGCNKEEHWETSITNVSNITGYSAQLTLDYNFGGKKSKTDFGFDLSTDPELKTDVHRGITEYKTNQTIVTYPSNLYANQTYYARTFMAGRKDTIWSEIISFTTLEDHPMPCSVSTGEIHYSGHDMTEVVGNLVEFEDPSNPGLFTYKAEAEIGDLIFTFAYEPYQGYHNTIGKIVRSDVPEEVVIGCWYEQDGTSCYYQAKSYQSVHVTKDIEGNVSISFCDLEMRRVDEGTCVDTQTISGRLKN